MADITPAAMLENSFSAKAVNNSGEATGLRSNGDGGAYYPYLMRGGAVIALSDLPEVTAAGWYLTLGDPVPPAISDAGQIVSVGIHNNQWSFFLLKPR